MTFFAVWVMRLEVRRVARVGCCFVFFDHLLVVLFQVLVVLHFQDFHFHRSHLSVDRNGMDRKYDVLDVLPFPSFFLAT